MNIFIGSDHAGFELKKFLAGALTEMGHTIIDCGAYSIDPDDDYPIYISKVAKAVSESEAVKVSEDEGGEASHYGANNHSAVGIVIGGSGQGEAIIANKFMHVRTALCYGGEQAEEIIKLSREHNNSNILSLGARFMEEDQALELVIKWLNTPFSGDERHIRRLHEIDKYEDGDRDAMLYE